jgi:MFS family permease
MTALRHRAFRRLWLAGLISDSGDWLLLVSLPILVYQLTGSTLRTSFAFLVELAPAVLLGPVAGYLADRLDRRRLLVGVSLAQAVTLLPLLSVDGPADLPVLYAVIAVEAALLTVFTPAKNALLPTLVPRDGLVSANSLVGLNQNLGRTGRGQEIHPEQFPAQGTARRRTLLRKMVPPPAV